MLIELIAIILLVIIFIGAYLFYSSQNGSKAVYQSTYAWKIDLMAILFGFYIIATNFYFYYQNYSLFILFPPFIIGSLQSMMHLSKWIIRVKQIQKYF